MNSVTKEMLSLTHYGMPRRSGRYPWGSGDNPFQHEDDFISRVDQLRAEKFEYIDDNGKAWTGDTAIAKSMGLSTTQFRTQLSLAKDERRARDVATAKALREKGYSLNQIAEKMGFNNDSSVRSLLNKDSEARMKEAKSTAEYIKTQIDKKGMVDVGTGVEIELGISKEKLNAALEILRLEGYPTYSGRVPQVTNPGQKTTIKVVGPPGTEHKDIYDYNNIHPLSDEYVSHDGGATFDPRFVYPKSMDSKRLDICYAEDGGKEKDGVIELRRGVPDLDLGESHYAQVRILVDDNKYLKGMAVYADDLPDGIDVRFNTNKSKDVPKMEVLKPIGKDPDNPFGSLIKDGINDPDKPIDKRGGQSYYYDENGKKQLSLINKRAEEGDWTEWSDKLPSQFLSKQSKELIKSQLNISIADRQAEYEEICSLNNPTVKKKLLETFASDCDSTAVKLKAAALPGQKYKVILPITSMKDDEVYAPTFENGETVALIRYPHGGTFEIPILKVNNRQKDAKNCMGNAIDAIGINSKVADRLSGADFDGDTVMIIPCNSERSKVKITSKPPLKDLEGFDPKMSYPYQEGMKLMKDPDKKTDLTQIEMGKISNLITDMTIKGAPPEELARAVRHSMVVIDAGKHKLNYKQSEIDNGIAALKKRYQGHIGEDGRYHEGASTLISKASSEVTVPKRQGNPIINEDGSISYKLSDNLYWTDSKGVQHMRGQKSKRMAETTDARTLSSGTVVEEAYAEYANSLKSMANRARKEMISTGKIEYSPEAKKKYEYEVSTLDAKLNNALMNAPRERYAQFLANASIEKKKSIDEDLSSSKKELKKISNQELTKARAMVGAKKDSIEITDKEWEAIQAGAIHENKLSLILNNTNIDKIRERATPRNNSSISNAKISRIKSLSNSGYTIAEIARKLGISKSTVSKYLN